MATREIPESDGSATTVVVAMDGAATSGAAAAAASPDGADANRHAFAAYARRGNRRSVAVRSAMMNQSNAHSSTTVFVEARQDGDGNGGSGAEARVGDAVDQQLGAPGGDGVGTGAIHEASPSTSRAKAPVVVRLDALISVPAMEQRVFDTWEAFHAYLQDYGQKTSQLYSVRSATPSSRRNSLISKKKAPQAQKLIPEQFVHYVKTITCTHGGKPRPRSTGVRPNHLHRAIECPAQINACVKKDPQGIWKVHVTNQHAWHNHDISEAIYNGYPEVRNALGADVLATVNILRKAEAKRKKILEYIVENTPHKPKMKDVHNLLSKMKKKDQLTV